MATENLQVRITADIADIKAAIASLTQSLQQTRQRGANVGTAAAASVGGLEGRIRRATDAAKLLFGALGAGVSLAALISASDEAAQISAKLQLATKNAAQLATAQRSVYEIAQRTRASLLASVDLYARIERSTRQQGLNQQTILKLTETINQAAAISGGGAGAEAALFQLSQALASGTLRGDELNSVLEQTPRLAQAIADGMDIPIGKLRATAEQGKLTSKQVLDALLKESETIQSEFGKFPPTIASGFTAIRNALVQYLSTSTQAQGAARDFAEALQAIAKALPTILDALIRLAPAILAFWAALKVNAALPALIAGFTQLRGAITLTQGSFTLIGQTGPLALTAIRTSLGVLIAAFAGWQIGKLLRDQFIEVRIFGIALVAGLLKAWAEFNGQMRVIGVAFRETFVSAFNWVLQKAESFYRALGNGLRNIPGVGDKLGGFYDSVADKLAGAQLSAEGLGAAVNRVRKETRDAMAEIEDGALKMVDAESAAEYATGSGAGGGGGIGTGGGGAGDAGKASKLAAQLAATNASLVQDAVQRALAQLQYLYDHGKVSIREYFAEKQRLELEGIDAALTAAQAERRAAQNAGEVADANAKITTLLRDRKQAVIDNQRAETEAHEELTRQLGSLQIRLLQANGETGRATRAALEEEFRELIVRLEAEGDTAGVALARKVINAEAFKAQLDQVGSVTSEAISRLQNVQQSTAAQVEAGMLSQSDAEARVNEQRVASLNILVQQRDKLLEIQQAARDAGDALKFQDATDQLEIVNGQIAQMSINTDSLGYKAAQVLKGALTQLFTDLADGSKSAGEALRDFVLNFIRGMAQIAASALATYLVLQILDAIYPGLGKATAALMGATANHSGGMAGAGATVRQLPVAMFAGAPRYHTGGIAGLGPDEVPIVAKRGEEVLTKLDPRHRDNGGLEGDRVNGRGLVKTPIVAIGDRAVADALASAAGEDIVLTHVRNNWEGLSRGN